MKIGIITLNGYFNYGNRLQNYALEQHLIKEGYETETLRINKHPKKNFIQLIKYMIKKVIKRNYKTNHSLYKERFNRFKLFSDNYLNESIKFLDNKNKHNINLSSYDFFIVGSDQVWNPYYTNMSDLYFLSFAPKNKRISYAASFGVTDLPSEYVELLKSELPKFKSISVRENEGANLIKAKVNKDVPVVLDPTLLLDQEEWNSLRKEFKNKPNSTYLLTYFLGDVSVTRLEYVNNIAEEYDLEIVNLSDDKYYTADPSEFLDLLAGSSMILTDSFHGTVFSIIFEVPFIVFERMNSHGSMRSRTNTLLTKLNLEERNVENIDKFELFNVNFSKAKEILEIEKNYSKDYIESAINN